MNNTKILYIGHSWFYINIENKYGILIDPFIKNNPKATFDYKKYQITHIFVTHGHSDHFGDAIEISKNTKAPIYSIFEIANYAIKNCATAIGTNLGGEIKLDFGSVLFLNALHSSSLSDGSYGGCASSILFKLNNISIMHLGDTALHSDMELYGNIYSPYVILCPIGGFYTMGINEACIASKMLKAKIVIPMHYNTFDLINADVLKFKNNIESQNNQKCLVMDINQEVDLDNLIK